MQNNPASDDLMTLARARPEDRDATLLRAATALFCQEPYHDRDAIRRFEQLAIHLLPKLSDSDRAYIAALLGGRSDAPTSVMRTLARDTIEIASPVLRHSPVLSTIDLLGVIAVTGPEHHKLIAGRTDLSADVLRALAIARQKAAAARHKNRTSDDESAAPAAVTPAAVERSVAAPVRPTMPTPDFGAFLASPPAHRLWILAEAASRGLAAGETTPARQLDQLLRRNYAQAQIVTAAKRGDRSGMLAGFSSALGLAVEIVTRLFDDYSGEPLVLMIKGAGLSVPDGNTVLLLGNKRIGESVDDFFRLAELLASLEQSTADAFVAAWRNPQMRRRPVHVPVYVDTGDRRPAAATPKEQSSSPAKRAQEG